MPELLTSAVRTIRLDERTLHEIFDSLDARASAESAERREHQRYLYRHKFILIQIQQPGAGSATNFVCPTRNVSKGGLACLHGGFLHAGSRVVAHLRNTRNGFQAVPGWVARCSHVQGTMHEIGIQFENWIDPSLFCHEAVRYYTLLAEPDKSTSALVRTHLAKLSSNLAVAADGDEVVELAFNTLYDLVIIEANLPTTDGLTAARILREKGYAGVLLGASAKSTDEARFKAAGCDSFLVKPYLDDSFGVLAKQHFQQPIYSTLEWGADVEKIISEFLRSLPTRVRALELAAVKRDARLATVVDSFRVTAHSLGFEQVAEMAEKVSVAAEVDDAAVLQSRVVELSRFCRRLRV